MEWFWSLTPEIDFKYSLSSIFKHLIDFMGGFLYSGGDLCLSVCQYVCVCGSEYYISSMKFLHPICHVPSQLHSHHPKCSLHTHTCISHNISPLVPNDKSYIYQETCKNVVLIPFSFPLTFRGTMILFYLENSNPRGNCKTLLTCEIHFLQSQIYFLYNLL